MSCFSCFGPALEAEGGKPGADAKDARAKDDAAPDRGGSGAPAGSCKSLSTSSFSFGFRLALLLARLPRPAAAACCCLFYCASAVACLLRANHGFGGLKQRNELSCDLHSRIDCVCA